jgi:probable FeS assembly SUF system protein SufT
MIMKTGKLIELKRELKAAEIPSGVERILPAGSLVRISQVLGSSYTVISNVGYMYRIEASDGDALGWNPPSIGGSSGAPAEFNEKAVWDQLKSIYDPEIPVNIVDLGLIYSCEITSLDDGKKIDVKMTMTAPGCGMANILKADVARKLGQLPEVKSVHVEVVFDPPWSPNRMSDAAKLQLGLDLGDRNEPLVRISR